MGTNEQLGTNIQKIKCGSLVVQVYTQVLIKATSKHVIKTWSMKQNHKHKYDHYVNARVLDLWYTQ